jgi:hypothetical protein
VVIHDVNYKDTQPIVRSQTMENSNRKSLRLPEFWVADPVAWFAHVEAHFELENLESQQHRYFNVIKALGQDTLRLIKNVIASPHPTTPYDVLKDKLLTNHTLSDFQKIERQFRMGELGPQQKPSELLAHLVELTPVDEMESKYLVFLFIQRLPKILRMQLGDDLDLDLQDIAERADRLWSIHAHDMAASVAAVAASAPREEECGQAGVPVAAVAPLPKRKQDQRTSRPSGKHAAAAGLCWVHRKHGAAAYRCDMPATCPMSHILGN